MSPTQAEVTLFTMFPLIDRSIPHVEERILSYLVPRDLAASMLVCRLWYDRAKPFICQQYVATVRREGEVPLCAAAHDGHHHMVTFLLRDKHLDVNEKWNNFRPGVNRKASGVAMTALMEAATEGHQGIIRLLLEREDVDVNVRSPFSDRASGYTALTWAAKHGHGKIVRMLLGRKEVEVNVATPIADRTPLMEAIYYGHMEVAELLLRHPAVDVNHEDMYGLTALSYAKGKTDMRMTKRRFDERRLNMRKVIAMLEKKNAICGL